MAPLELCCPGKVLWISHSDTLLTVKKEVTLSGTNLDWLHLFFLFFLNSGNLLFREEFSRLLLESKRKKKKPEKKELCCFGEVVLCKCSLLSFPLSWRWKFWLCSRDKLVCVSTGWQETRSVAESFGELWGLLPAIMVILRTALLSLFGPSLVS